MKYYILYVFVCKHKNEVLVLDFDPINMVSLGFLFL